MYIEKTHELFVLLFYNHRWTLEKKTVTKKKIFFFTFYSSKITEKVLFPQKQILQ